MTKQTRTAKPPKLDTPTARDALAPRRSPYWHRVAMNRFIGFRRMTKASEGTWLLKARVNGEEIFETLGSLAEHPADKRYAEASAKASAWFAKVDKSASAPVSAWTYTIGDALAAYDKSHRDGTPEGDKKAKRLSGPFNVLVVPFTLDGKPIDEDGVRSWVHTPIAKLTDDHFHKWRAWMRTVPARGAGGGARKVSTMNRDLNTFRAALNLAKRTYKFDDVWSEPLKTEPLKKGEGARGAWAYLSAKDRARLLEGARKVCPALVSFLIAHMVAPIRPGAFAHMRVANYIANHNGDGPTLYVGKDKANGDRYVPLPQDLKTRTFFAEACRSKLPSAFLFTDENGKAWNGTSWNAAIHKAAAAAGLSEKITVYCLRHSRITDLVNNGTPALTIAALAGTSVDMIEKHYYKLLAAHAREALKVVGAGW